jgi:hypothetical protein
MLGYLMRLAVGIFLRRDVADSDTVCCRCAAVNVWLASAVVRERPGPFWPRFDLSRARHVAPLIG